MRRILYAAAALALLIGLIVTGRGSGQQGARELLPTSGWASLSGRIVYKGTPPTPGSLVPIMSKHADKACCLDKKATPLELVDNTWIVDPKTKGVANVLIYFKAAPGTYFPIHDKDKKRTKKASLDQPHCAFVPHMLAIFPSYYDGEKDVPTGETFEVKNSAPVPHNTRATGNPLRNQGFNITLPPGAAKQFQLNPQPLPVLINCDIHPWMNAKIGVYDHPYFAITGADGSFKIERIPAGADITLMGWHEDIGYIEGRDGRKVRAKDSEKLIVPDIAIEKRQ